MIKRFIVWYILYRCRGQFTYKDKVVRAFSEDFFVNKLCVFLDTLKSIEKLKAGDEK